MVVIAEGLFYTSGTGFLCYEKGGDKFVFNDSVSNLQGTRCRVLAHHMPPDPVIDGAWGGGCCHYKPADCPAGHHTSPAFLYHFYEDGTLKVGDHWLRVGDRYVNFDMLRGHDCRFAVVPLEHSLGEGDVASVKDMAMDLMKLRSMIGVLAKGE